jgi:hypothetical protein
MPVLILAAALLAAAQAPPAVPGQASTTVAMTCPIGGASFEFVRPAASDPIGTRPDGKPYGPVRYPLALPECPDNGLVMYKDYDQAEVEKLTPMVASADYQALRKDSAYYRAYRLMRELGEAPDDYLWALLQASWEADNRPELRTRYQTELIEAAAAVPARPQDMKWIGMEGRVINALRELGRFDEAKAKLTSLSLASLDVPLPQAGQGSEDEIKDARNRRFWLDYFKALGAAINRWDRSAEPFDMIPRAIAIRLCVAKEGGLDEQQRVFCKTQAAAVEELRAARVDRTKELEALRKSREESGR